MRTSLLFAGSALTLSLLNPAGAWAQCISTLPGIVIPGGPTLDASSFLPFSRGSAVNSIVSVLNTASTAFLTNMNDFAAYNKIYAEHFPPENRPSRTTVEVSRLPTPIAVELKVIAAID